MLPDGKLEEERETQLSVYLHAYTEQCRLEVGTDVNSIMWVGERF